MISNRSSVVPNSEGHDFTMLLCMPSIYSSFLNQYKSKWTCGSRTKIETNLSTVLTWNNARLITIQHTCGSRIPSGYTVQLNPWVYRTVQQLKLEWKKILGCYKTPLSRALKWAPTWYVESSGPKPLMASLIQTQSRGWPLGDLF